MGERFDLVSRVLAGRLSRRRALWLAAQALFTGAVATQVSLPAAAQSSGPSAPSRPCPPHRVRCGSVCCPANQSCVGGKCCQNNRVCNGTCCGASQKCVGGDCCAANKACGNVCCQTGFTCQHNQCQQRGGGSGPSTVDEGLSA